MRNNRYAMPVFAVLLSCALLSFGCAGYAQEKAEVKSGAAVESAAGASGAKIEAAAGTKSEAPAEAAAGAKPEAAPEAKAETAAQTTPEAKVAAAQRPAFAVYFLDVDQGDATVITTPSGKTVLIDGGMGGEGYKKKDKAKTVIIPFLKEKGIAKLDYVIITHPDFDHIGGLVYLIENTKKESENPIEIVEFLDPGHPGTTHLYKELLTAIKNRPDVKYRIVKAGEKLDLGKEVTAEIIAPSSLGSDPNESSTVMKLTYGDVSFMFTGDAEFGEEKAMIAEQGDKLKSTVLKAGHHGSQGSSSEAFLQKVKPEVITINAGWNNKFMLPDKIGLGRLTATGAKIYRTDYQGTITVTSDGKTYEVTTAKEAPPPDKRWDVVPTLSEEQKLNINTASRAEIEKLPRIGKGKADDIIKRRPYKSIDDLRKVPGIGPKIFEKLQPLVTVGDGVTVAPAEGGAAEGAKPKAASPRSDGKLDINTASEAELEKIPGVGPKMAKVIIDGRPYESLDELKNIPGIGPAKLETIQEFLAVGPQKK
jgi:competence ComEA-like helix-hairpin-helix protein